jgi:hypothetical protein
VPSLPHYVYYQACWKVKSGKRYLSWRYSIRTNDFCLAKLLIRAFFGLSRLYVNKCGKVKKESNALRGAIVFLDVKGVPFNEGAGAIEQ